MINKSIILALFASLMITNVATAQKVAKVLSDIPYGSPPTERGPLTVELDFYRPSTTCTGARPTILMFHGGSFKGGDKTGSRMPNYAKAFAQQGWNAVSVNYRLLKHRPIVGQEFMAILSPEMGADNIAQGTAAAGAIEDSLRALNFIVTNAADNCIDADRIVVMGTSAGAMIALALGYGLDELAIRRPKLAGVVNFWGATDPGFIDGRDLPLFIVHGFKDKTVPFDNARKLTERALATNTPVQVHVFRNKKHGLNVFNTKIEGETVMKHLLTFLHEVFKGNRPPTVQRVK